MKLSAAAKRQGAALANLGNATSYLQTQDGALQVAGKVLDRISELKTLYADPTKNTSDLANYDSEFTALQAQLTALTTEKFNGVALFGTNSLTVSVTEDAATGSAVTMAARDLGNTSTGVGTVTLAGISNLGNTGLALSVITAAIQSVATMRATNGAEQSRLGFASQLLTTNKANLEAATSRITDVDVASESTQLARWNTLVQAGTSMLSQANQSAQTALKLLQ
jgi:flagellin